MDGHVPNVVVVHDGYYKRKKMTHSTSFSLSLSFSIGKLCQDSFLYLVKKKKDGRYSYFLPFFLMYTYTLLTNVWTTSYLRVEIKLETILPTPLTLPFN